MSFELSDVVQLVSNCDGGTFFIKRQVIKTYTFTNQCGSQSSLLVSPYSDIPSITVIQEKTILFLIIVTIL